MRIAVDARLFPVNEGQGYFIKQLFHRLARRHETHHFIFFFDKPINPVPDTAANITTVVITPEPTNIFLYKWWYDIKLTLALKKHKATIFIGTNGICSLTTAVPQLLIIQNLVFLHDSVSYPKSVIFFYKRFSAKFLKKAAAIITFSDFTKQEVTNVYKIAEQKLTAIGCAAKSFFKPLDYSEKEKVKEQYAQGCEYFIFYGGRHPAKNLIGVLKAFSIFKKWQKTNMKLLITISEKQYKDGAEKLKSYKYKNEVILLHNLSAGDLAKVTAGAYATIFPSAGEGFGLAALEALQCEVPVITSANSSTAEIAADAALYADAAKPEETAEQMKRIFKDEELRNKLVASGKELAKLYTFDKTLALIWQKIEEAAAK